MSQRPNFSYQCACGDWLKHDRIYAGRMVVCPKCSEPVITPVRRGERARRLDGELELKTERLELRLAKPGDWKELLPVVSDAQNYRYELCYPETRAQLIKNLKRCRFPAGFRKSLHLQFLARLRGADETIGLLHLKLSPDHLSAYIGLMFHHPFHGMGYGTEAVRELVWCSFKRLGLHRLSSSCDAENRACIRVLEKSGFELEGTMIHAAYHRDRGWVDIPSYAQLNPADR